jgi:hypothetical protein
MSRFILGATWDDAPHLSEEAKADLWASIPEYQRDARTRGIPTLGAGAIYPIPEADILVDPFALPDHWPRGFGQDVGWGRTAGIWAAVDPPTKVVYLYSEYYKGEAEPIIHVEGWRARGLWIPGRIDPASRGRSQVDGQRLFDLYHSYGLRIDKAQNAVESGIYVLWTGLSTGKVKVFRSLVHWLSEYRLYHRDEKGRVVKKRDHLMDATRYLLASGTGWFATKPPGWRDDGTEDPLPEPERFVHDVRSVALGWMA